METIWTTIPGFENYEVNSQLEIRNKRRKVVLSGWLDHRTKKGSGGEYMKLTIKLKGKKINLKVHRLIALAFIPNPSNSPYINHKDGNKLNNAVENLEWCTAKENVHHAIKNGLFPQGFKSKIVLDIHSGVYYNSLKEAADLYGFDRRSLASQLSGQCKNKTQFIYA